MSLLLGLGILAASSALGGAAQDVSRAVKANSAARDQAEWGASDFTPDKVFARAAERNAWKGLCAALTSRSGHELALFEEAITDTVSTGFTCRKTLLRRIRLHWRTSGMALKQRRETLSLLFGENMSTPVEPVTLPSIERAIDATTGPTLISADLPAKEIALTFDDGPHPTRTARLLEILRQTGVRATFFEVGANAQKFPAISKSVADAGHSVGSHTWSHPDLRKLDVPHATHEITAGRDAVALAAEASVPFFRFPFGARNATLTGIVKKERLASFLWNMDTLDWKIHDPSQLYDHVISEIDREGRGILLFHDIHEQTLIVLPHVLEELRNRGFTTVVFK